MNPQPADRLYFDLQLAYARPVIAALAILGLLEVRAGRGAAGVSLAAATGVRHSGGGNFSVPFAGANPDVVPDVFCGVCGGLPVEPALFGFVVLRVAAAGIRAADALEVA